MANYKLREEVIQLRLQGYTYGQIKRQLSIPKATLSDWLRNLPLTPKQLKLLQSNRSQSRNVSREKFIQTFAQKRISRLKVILESQKSLLPLSDKELFLAGLFLYWGEGGKHHGTISISNTNPQIIKFALFWMVNSLKISSEKIKVGLHVYQDMNINEVIDYWSSELKIPISQFNKPYVKKSNRSDLTYKSFGHGTCRLVACSVELSEKLAMSLKAIAENYGAKNDLFWYN